MRHQSRYRVLACLVVGTLLGSAVQSTHASATAAPPPGESLTLVTGDRLRVVPGPRGEFVVQVLPTPGRDHVGFLRDGNSLVPSDAQPLVDAGRLDPRLFDLATLPRDRPAPVIVTDALTRSPLPGKDVRALPSVDGAALTPEPGFWGWFTASGASVWLDGVSKPALDVSVPQIGAPTAWENGYTGRGVTVGVLDTGIDGTHPDLAGKVVESRDFTGTGPADQIGHGTHVAGIIAGTGAASGGRFRGVAPDADLVSGKVCTAIGCQDSAVIAGLEWIAPKVRVANLSLGGGYSDGTDPLSRAVDSLTARYGTLFVASAGNDRSLGNPDPLASVTTPAAADSAIAVGSVTTEDTTSPFSPRQPRKRDYAVKPDIAAPGSDIVSARVVGTPAGDRAPVDEHYAALSGTSFAAPHVSGAAALLAQRRPDWSADRLKSVLVSSAKPTADVFEQGAGRVDAARAVEQRVSAVGGGVGYGFVPWPRTGRLSKTVTYRNDGDAAVSVVLSSDNPVFVPAVGQVVVPARGSVDVTVYADTAGRAPGRQSGRLTGRADGVVVQTGLTAVLEAESYNVAVTLKGRTGATASTVAKAVNVDSGAAVGVRLVNGAGVARLPKGRYDFQAVEVAASGEVSLVARPGVAVDRDASVGLDATGGRLVSTTVDGTRATQVSGEVSLVSGQASGERTSALVWFFPAGQKVYLVPTRGKVTDHTFLLAHRATLEAPDSVYHLAFVSRGGIPDSRYSVRPRDLARVDARYYAQGAPGKSLRADYALLDAPGVNTGALQVRETVLPGRRAEYFTTGVTWQHVIAVFPADTSDSESTVSYRGYRAGQYATHWNRGPLSPSLGAPEIGFGVSRVGDELSVAVAPLSSGDPDQSTILPLAATGTTDLSRDGVSLGHSDLPGIGTFPIPSTPGRYTLRTVVDRVVPWSVLGTHADITWTFHEDGTTPPPLLAVRTTADLDDQDTARPGTLLPLRLHTQRQAGVPASSITTLRLEYSTTDGRTWHPTPTLHIPTGDGLALVKNPTTPGFISLHITATDTNGNTVDQTVLRAYQVR
ncbi:S8 family serine peptidase [Actinokineospora cianjurensis]|uniref:Subtilisin family serine protease n=1 Tax=Actinokineospora cianjurensis TaxID=585224 RepID=A0A421B118_9PSEU|nr:S8 family serine peptidase [Actinokineospora cianjurensis]RLK58109.1 subtilisin family serine protease [Actinokineospora cianjurensis]